jgi:phosphoserine aminotransferase
MGVIEMSHRSKPIDQMRQETEDLVKELMGLDDNYHVLFLQGGASQQFFMVPMNLIPEGKGADYITTGSWSQKAIKEAKLLNDNIHIAYSGEEGNFGQIPQQNQLSIRHDAAYLHLTSNNTIFGTQFLEFPDSPIPLVADMSSDILSHTFDPKPFGLIYAGAQKNLGPAGVTLVIVRKDMLEHEKKKTPTLLKYSTHVEKQSMYNTPPVFGIHIMNLVLKWLKEQGGVATMERRNRNKADLLYRVIDDNDFYIGHASKDSRSLMNVTWNLADKSLEDKFLTEAKGLKLEGLKGHRSVGGFRASIYNAMPPEGCQVLAEFMSEFAQKNG